MNQIISTTDPEKRDSCGTPPEILDAVRSALGGTIHLDPCSNDDAQQLVRAETYWTEADDCTRQIWKGGPHATLWCNPPYSVKGMRSVVPHIVKNAPAFGRGAIVLVNAVTDTEYGAALIEVCDAVIYTKRINFVGQKNGNSHRQMFCVWGCDTAQALAGELDAMGIHRATTFKHDAIRRWSIRMAQTQDADRIDEVNSWLWRLSDGTPRDDFKVFCSMAEDGEVIQ